MSYMARIGVFGNPKKRDYVSRQPVWHSCFVLSQMVNPGVVSKSNSMKITLPVILNEFSKIFGSGIHPTGSSAEGLTLLFTKANKPDEPFRHSLYDMDVMVEYN